MAAFTALAIGLAAGAVAGSVARRKKAGDANGSLATSQASTLASAPAPIAAAGSLAAPAPPDATKAASEARLSGVQAMAKLKKKNTGIAGGMKRPGAGSLAAPAAVTTPRTLSGY